MHKIEGFERKSFSHGKKIPVQFFLKVYILIAMVNKLKWYSGSIWRDKPTI